MTDNLVDAFTAVVAQHGERVALVESDGTRVSYSNLSDRAKRLAGHWSVQGMAAGDRVLLAMPICADLYAALAAIWSLGATAVLPEPAMGLRGVRHAVALANCKGVVASGHYTWLRLLPRLWGKPLFRMRNGQPLGDQRPINPNDTALISFTSGSTGVPKAIARSHRFLQAQQAAVRPLLDSANDEIDLVAFPVFALINLAEGRTSVLPNWRMSRLDQIDPSALTGWIAEQGITRALLPPALCEVLAQGCRPSSLTTVFTGGGPVFPDVADRLLAKGVRVVAVYGSTEAEPIAEIDMAELSPADRAAMTSGKGLLAGRPVAGLQLKIVDGEIVVAGDHVNKGYLDPARDAETKIVEGSTIWHRTGDAGELDQDGRLWLRGRHGADVGGLYPFVVETAARSWPGVKVAALSNLSGQPVLAIEGDGKHRDDWTAAAKENFELTDIRVISKIPLDRRHRSKVDYTALRKALG